jgi:integrase/recombinase XerD
VTCDKEQQTMRKHNPDNERIKRQYFTFLTEAKRQDEQTVDAAAKALDRFEVYTRHRDFKVFHHQQAIAFKSHLAEQGNQRTGEKLSKATLNSTLANLKRFFQWLSDKPGYKSRLQYSDAEYFNLSGKDTRVATARREQAGPTVEQVKHAIAKMPAETEIELRNRALIAFTLLTGARDSAIASMKLKHVDLIIGSVYQDAREVRTKNSKTFTTYFFPVGDEIRQIVAEWMVYLREEKLWGNDDPLFPATAMAQGATRQFEVAGLKQAHWSTASPIRKIFRDAFASAGLQYFNPHSIRNTLVRLGQTLCQTPEEFKVWSQNIGHEGVMTTLRSYGEVADRRQGEIMQGLATPRLAMQSDFREIAKAVVREMRDSGVETPVK